MSSEPASSTVASASTASSAPEPEPEPASASASAHAGINKPHLCSSVELGVHPRLHEDRTVVFQCDTGRLDLSGDVGAVGRLKYSASACAPDATGAADAFACDLKGGMYRGALVPSLGTLAVLDLNARCITATAHEYVHLRAEGSIFDMDGVADGAAFRDDDDDRDDGGGGGDGADTRRKTDEADVVDDSGFEVYQAAGSVAAGEEAARTQRERSKKKTTKTTKKNTMKGGTDAAAAAASTAGGKHKRQRTLPMKK